MSVYKTDIENGVPDYQTVVFEKTVRFGSVDGYVVGSVTKYNNGYFSAAVTFQCNRNGIIIHSDSHSTEEKAIADVEKHANMEVL